MFPTELCEVTRSTDDRLRVMGASLCWVAVYDLGVPAVKSLKSIDKVLYWNTQSISFGDAEDANPR